MINIYGLVKELRYGGKNINGCQLLKCLIWGVSDFNNFSNYANK